MGFDREDELDMDKKTEEIINEYLDNIDIDTEGIWTKVDAGLHRIEQETAMKDSDKDMGRLQPDFKSRKNKKRKITAYIWGGVGIAAVVAATIIILPLATGVRTKDSDTLSYERIIKDTDALEEDTNTETANIKEDVYSEEGVDNSLRYEDAAKGEAIDDLEAQTNSMTDENGAEEAQTVETTEARETTPEIDNVEAIDVKLRIAALKDDKLLCEVAYIEENEFGILAGQEIYVRIAGDETFLEYESGITLAGLLAQSSEEGVYLFYPYVD